MKALVGAFNREKALVGAFSVIVQPVVEPMDRFAALVLNNTTDLSAGAEVLRTLGRLDGLVRQTHELGDALGGGGWPPLRHRRDQHLQDLALLLLRHRAHGPLTRHRGRGA